MKLKNFKNELEKERKKYYFEESSPLDEPIEIEDEVDYKESVDNLNYNEGDEQFFTLKNRPKPEDI